MTAPLTILLDAQTAREQAERFQRKRQRAEREARDYRAKEQMWLDRAARIEGGETLMLTERTR